MHKQCRSLRQSQERYPMSQMPSPTRNFNPQVNGEISRLMEMNRDQIQQIDELRSNYRFLEAQLHLQKDSECRQQQQMNELQSQNKQLQDCIKDQHFKLQIEQRDVEIYQNQVLKLEEECNYQSETIKTQKAQLDTIQEKIESLQNRYQMERQLMKQQLLDSGVECKQATQEMKRLTEEVKTLKTQKLDYKAVVQESMMQEKQQIEGKIHKLAEEYQQYKQQKQEEIQQLQLELNNSQSKVCLLENDIKQYDQIQAQKIQTLEFKLNTTLTELDGQVQIQKQLNTQIHQLQTQIAQNNQTIQGLNQEKQSFQKEKAVIESYYLDQLQRQDQQLQQMLRSNISMEQKQSYQKLQSSVDQRDQIIIDLQSEVAQFKENQRVVRDLEKKNATLVMEVERLNNILKQKLTELENHNRDDNQNKSMNNESDMWRSKFVALNKQYHQSQEQLMVVRTELDSYKRPRKENVDPSR